MNIVVEIKAPELANALLAIAAAFGGNVAVTKTAVVAETKKEKTVEKVENTKVESDKEIEAEKVTPEEIPPSDKVAADAKDKAQDAETTSEETTYTLEQVREKLAGLSRGGKRAEVKALIESCGVSKLTEIPAEKYAEVMKKAGEL